MRPTTASTLRRAAGFTLTELMVVILIIGLLVGLVGPKVFDVFMRSQRDIALIELKSIKEALDNYAIRNGGKYPQSLDELVQEDEEGFKYLDTEVIPTDPWESEYQYLPPMSGDEFELYSFGSDGAPGGEQDSRDIHWNDDKKAQ